MAHRDNPAHPQRVTKKLTRPFERNYANVWCKTTPNGYIKCLRVCTLSASAEVQFAAPRNRMQPYPPKGGRPYPRLCDHPAGCLSVARCHRRSRVEMALQADIPQHATLPPGPPQPRFGGTEAALRTPTPRTRVLGRHRDDPTGAAESRPRHQPAGFRAPA